MPVNAEFLIIVREQDHSRGVRPEERVPCGFDDIVPFRFSTFVLDSFRSPIAIPNFVNLLVHLSFTLFNLVVIFFVAGLLFIVVLIVKIPLIDPILVLLVLTVLHREITIAHCAAV